MFRLVLLYWSLYFCDLAPGNEDDSCDNINLFKMNDVGLAGRAGDISSATVCVPCRLTSSWMRRNLREKQTCQLGCRRFMARELAIDERSKSQTILSFTN
jgi:hypothetical protein